MVRHLVVIGMVFLMMVAAIPGVASAAGSIDIMTTPSSQTIAPDEVTTVDVVVTNVSGGVGSYSGSLSVNSSVAEIQSVSIAGDPLQGGSVDISPDNSSVEFSGAAANTNDSGTVSIASVSLKAVEVGHSELDLAIETVGDEAGTAYTISAVDGSKLTVEANPVSMQLNPETANSVEDNVRRLHVNAENVPQGVGTYEYTVSVDNTSVAEIASVSTVGAGYSSVNISTANSSAHVTASAAEIYENQSVQIGEITLRALEPGHTSISLKASTIGDVQGNGYNVGTSNGSTIRVESKPDPVTGFENPSNDTDGDGRLDDVNGDGVRDVNDVTAIWSHRDDNVIKEYGSFYDYNDDGVFDVNDVTKLWKNV